MCLLLHSRLSSFTNTHNHVFQVDSHCAFYLLNKMKTLYILLLRQIFARKMTKIQHSNKWQSKSVIMVDHCVVHQIVTKFLLAWFWPRLFIFERRSSSFHTITFIGYNTLCEICDVQQQLRDGLMQVILTDSTNDVL